MRQVTEEEALEIIDKVFKDLRLAQARVRELEHIIQTHSSKETKNEA